MKMTKRHLILPVICIVLLIFMAGNSHAAHLTTNPGDIAGGIVNSSHNLSSGWPFSTAAGTAVENPGDWTATSFNGTSELCVFCHTPHHGDPSQGPLWNRNVDATTFQIYGTMDTGQAGPGLPGPGSLACLSCHDGTSQFDAVINAPGKGTFNGTQWTSGITGNTADQGYFFKMDEGGPFAVPLDHFASASCEVCHDEASFLAPWGGAENLVIGKDLTNDHPIGIVYRGQEGNSTDASVTGAVASLRPSDTIIADIDLDTTVQGKPLSCADRGDDNCNNWAVNGFIKTDASIVDILKGPNNNMVECISCHDPHFANRTNPEIDVTYYVKDTSGGTRASHDDVEVLGLYLRRVGGNSDSGVCRTCHGK
jgi:hypothetical protein